MNSKLDVKARRIMQYVAICYTFPVDMLVLARTPSLQFSLRPDISLPFFNTPLQLSAGLNFGLIVQVW